MTRDRDDTTEVARDAAPQSWSRSLADSELIALNLLATAMSATRDFVRDWCFGDFRWEPADQSPCSEAMCNADYFRSDRTTLWGPDPFDACNADYARSVLLATDLLAGAGVLLSAGIATAATLPTLRASFERSLSVVWVTNPEVDPRQMYARSVLERINGFDHAIQSAPSPEAKDDFKLNRKATRESLSIFFDQVTDTKASGAAKDLTVADQRIAILTARADELAERAIEGDPVLSLYPTLSYFSHPNPVGDSLWATGVQPGQPPLLRTEVQFTARAVKNTMMTLGTALLQIHDWMGWQARA